MTISVIAPQLIAKLFTGRQLGIAMGIFTAMMPLGTVLSLNLLSLLGESFGWRTSIWLCVLITVVALILFAIVYSPAPQKKQEKPPESMSFINNLGSVGISVWLLSAIWMFYNGVFASITTFTPIFLKVSGFIIAEAGFLTSIIMLPSILLSPAFGLLIGKFSRKSAFIIAGSLIWTIVVLLVPVSGKFILAPMVLLGLTSSLITVPTYVLIAEVTDSEKLGLAYGIMSSTVNLGILAGPALAGLTIDITDSYQASYYLDSGFALMIALSAIVLFLKLNWIVLHPLKSSHY
jgi:predicted MFS family arabinose efflux permease